MHINPRRQNLAFFTSTACEQTHKNNKKMKQTNKAHKILRIFRPFSIINDKEHIWWHPNSDATNTNRYKIKMYRLQNVIFLVLLLASKVQGDPQANLYWSRPENTEYVHQFPFAGFRCSCFVFFFFLSLNLNSSRSSHFGLHFTKEEENKADRFTTQYYQLPCTSAMHHSLVHNVTEWDTDFQT